MMPVGIEVVSQPWITPEGKAQADSKAQQPRQVVSISRGLQRRHRGSGGVRKPLLSIFPACMPIAAFIHLHANELKHLARKYRSKPRRPTIELTPGGGLGYAWHEGVHIKRKVN
jgi:hypothetical protein